MSKFKILIVVFALLFTVGYAQAESIWFSPLTAIPVGPAGPSSMLFVSPYSDPSTALLVKATSPVKEEDFQWVLLGLTVQAQKAIKVVEICYEVTQTTVEPTYISQVRLTTMTTPDKALVIHDDPTNLTEISPTCYKSYTTRPRPKVNGTITLELKMVFGSASDEIKIGGIRFF